MLVSGCSGEASMVWDMPEPSITTIAGKHKQSTQI